MTVLPDKYDIYINFNHFKCKYEDFKLNITSKIKILTFNIFIYNFYNI